MPSTEQRKADLKSKILTLRAAIKANFLPLFNDKRRKYVKAQREYIVIKSKLTNAQDKLSQWERKLKELTNEPNIVTTPQHATQRLKNFTRSQVFAVLPSEVKEAIRILTKEQI